MNHRDCNWLTTDLVSQHLGELSRQKDSVFYTDIDGLEQDCVRNGITTINDINISHEVYT